MSSVGTQNQKASPAGKRQPLKEHPVNKICMGGARWALETAFLFHSKKPDENVHYPKPQRGKKPRKPRVRQGSVKTWGDILRKQKKVKEEKERYYTKTVVDAESGDREKFPKWQFKIGGEASDEGVQAKETASSAETQKKKCCVHIPRPRKNRVTGEKRRGKKDDHKKATEGGGSS